jgi:hypothetical protein
MQEGHFINPSNARLNPICHLLALLGAHHILHVNRIRVNVFLVRYVSGTYAHHQEHWILSCSIWFSAQSFWVCGGLHEEDARSNNPQENIKTRSDKKRT